jgi:type I restriction enzyme S subunit
MVLLKVNANVLDARFAVLSIYGGAAKQYITDLSVGSTVAHFNMSDIKNIPFLMPELNEQREIAQYLETVIADFDVAIGVENQGIASLDELKSVLTANVVTGKIKV